MNHTSYYTSQAYQTIGNKLPTSVHDDIAELSEEHQISLEQIKSTEFGFIIGCTNSQSLIQATVNEARLVTRR